MVFNCFAEDIRLVSRLVSMLEPYAKYFMVSPQEQGREQAAIRLRGTLKAS